MDRSQLLIPFPRGGGGQVVVERAGHAGGWPDGLSWVIFAVLLALLLLAIASLALDWYRRSQPIAPPGRNDALAELDLRYARGEIGRDEYLQRRVDLGGTVVPAPPSEGTTVVGPPAPQT
jgi:putative membrane protein